MRSSLPTLSLVALCLSLGARAAPFTTRSQQLQEGGCYKDDLTNRVLGSNGPQGSATISDVSMSIERCKRYCFSADASHSYRYAGVEWGRECFCGNDFLTDLVQTDRSECAGMPCTGNGGEYCGNANRIQIFSRDHWDPLSTATASVATSTDVIDGKEGAGRGIPSPSTRSDSGSGSSASTLSLTTSGASAGSTAGPVSSDGGQGLDDDDSTDANKAATTSAATSVATTYSTLPDSSAAGQVSSQATSAGTTSQAISSQATSQATSSQATSQATSAATTSSQATTSQSTTSQATTSQSTTSQSSSSQAASSQGSKTTISSKPSETTGS